MKIFILSISIFLFTHTLAIAESPETLRQNFIEFMVKEHNFSSLELKEILQQAEKKDSILQAIARPAEKVKPWWKYKRNFVTKRRIQDGVVFWKENKYILDEAKKRYGIPPNIIVSILGVETNYGTYPLRYRVLDALSTLGFYYARRGKFFRSELMHFLLLTREEKINPLEIKGSYAGAMGKPQFMPSSYRRLAIDFDKDGKIDIWKSNADIIGSIAFYLARNKWQRNQPIAVKAHGFSEKKMNSQYKVQDLRRSGIKLPLDWDNELKANLIELEGEFGKEYWVVLQNFKSILSYNPRNKYAMAVFQLAEKLKEAVKK